MKPQSRTGRTGLTASSAPRLYGGGLATTEQEMETKMKLRTG